MRTSVCVSSTRLKSQARWHSSAIPSLVGGGRHRRIPGECLPTIVANWRAPCSAIDLVSRKIKWQVVEKDIYCLSTHIHTYTGMHTHMYMHTHSHKHIYSYTHRTSVIRGGITNHRSTPLHVDISQENTNSFFLNLDSLGLLPVPNNCNSKMNEQRVHVLQGSAWRGCGWRTLGLPNSWGGGRV